MNGLKALCVLLGVSAATAALAQEQAWVGSQLQIGLHESTELSSTIVELLPTGTALEVLERDGDMARVRIEGGASGWVDARFLDDEAPRDARAEELERELAGAQAALADAQAKLVAAEQAAAAAPAASEPTPEQQAIASDALREMQALAEENQRLKQQVAELQAMQRMSLEQVATARAEAAAATSTPAPATVVQTRTTAAGTGLRWQTWHLVLMGSILLLSFAAGGWLVDWGVRRRHGGFRI